MGIQEIISKHGSTGSTEIGDTQKLDISIDESLAKNGDYMPIFSKVIRQELSHDNTDYIYLRCRLDFTSNAVGTEAPDFMHLGIPAINTSDELRSFGTPTTIVRRPTDGSNWYKTGNVFGEVTVDGMSRTRSEQNYN